MLWIAAKLNRSLSCLFLFHFSKFEGSSNNEECKEAYGGQDADKWVAG